MAVAILVFRGTIPDNLMLPPYWWGSWELWECETLQISTKMSQQFLKTAVKATLGFFGQKWDHLEKGSFQKVHFPETRENLEILENPLTVEKQRRIRYNNYLVIVSTW